MPEPGDVANSVSGFVIGPVLQSGTIAGDVHIHHTTTPAQALDRQPLLQALRAMTLPVTIDGALRTGFVAAPGRLLTYSDKVSLHDAGSQDHPSLISAVEPGDELWGLGFPTGREPEAQVAGLHCPAVLGDSDSAHLLDVTWGRIGAGSTGGPVLNWRTGGVCGLMVITSGGTWLVGAGEIIRRLPGLAARGARTWLDLLTDSQLQAAGLRYPGPAVRTYLAEVQQLADEHPYSAVVQQGPSLAEFYLPQQLRTDTSRRVTPAELIREHKWVQVLGDPGVGKSSMIRHLVATTWRSRSSSSRTGSPRAST